MKSYLSSNVLIGLALMRLLPLAIALLLAGCQTATRISATDTADAIRRDICARAWRGVTTSRHDVLTDRTKLEIAQDTAARAAYCRGV